MLLKVIKEKVKLYYGHSCDYNITIKIMNYILFFSGGEGDGLLGRESVSRDRQMLNLNSFIIHIILVKLLTMQYENVRHIVFIFLIYLCGWVWDHEEQCLWRLTEKNKISLFHTEAQFYHSV